MGRIGAGLFAVSAVLFLAGAARAEGRLLPPVGLAPEDIPTVVGPRPLAAWSVAAGLTGRYTHHPPGSLLSLEPAVAVGLLHYLEIGAAAPVRLVLADGDTPRRGGLVERPAIDPALTEEVRLHAW